MSRLLLLRETTRTLRKECLYTIGRLRVDGRTGGLLGLVDTWAGRVKGVDVVLDRLEEEQMFADAARMGEDILLDAVARDFGRDLKAAVKEDYKSLRWLRYWKTAPSSFVRGALAEQASTMRGWLETPDAALVPYVPRLEAALASVEEALKRDAELQSERGRVWIVREELVKYLNDSRGELEAELEAIARREDLDRSWVASFFRTTRPPREDEGEGEGVPTTP